MSSYLICTTPRSGSNVLCDLLGRSEVMGWPKELFNRRSMIEPFARTNGLVDPSNRLEFGRYLDEMRAATESSNGVFGAKVLFSQLRFALRFRAARELFRTSRLIWLTRSDVLGQAVSMYIAKELRAWSVSGEERQVLEGLTRRDLVYRGDDIGWLVSDLGAQQGGWLELFAVNQRPFLHVTYEELLSDADDVCKRICAYCGVETDFDFSLEQSQYVRQRDAVNADFRRQYAEASPLKVDADRSQTGADAIRR